MTDKTDEELLKPRIITAYQQDKDRPDLDCRFVTLSCGHVFWTPAPLDLSWPPQVCADCLNELVERLRKRQRP